MPTTPASEIAESCVPLGTPIYTVAELNREARETLEDSLPQLWVAGEISNLARPGSGHIYFSLKDEQAQVRCAMFRGASRSLKFQPDDGLQVIVRARVTIYEPRGSYQLVVEYMEPAGEGLLRRKLEELKKKLASEGLFDTATKLALPELPRRIGVITSPTGAAVRDILQILRRRFPAVPVVIYPVQVQGTQAKHDIVTALKTAADRRECDVLIIGRGGGSLEDLWAFNEEIVARAIFDCPIPTVSAVGHEVDVTIADLVADLRAPTPSGAAELVVPDARAWLDDISALQKRAANAVERASRQRRRQLEQLTGRLKRREPGFLLRQHAQRLDELGQRMSLALENRLTMDRLRLRNIRDKLRAAAPADAVRARQQRLGEIRSKLAGAVDGRVDRMRQKLSVMAAKLQAVSPLGTLERGYAIVTDEKTGRVIRDAGELRVDQNIEGRLARGVFQAIVRRVTKS
jgi:exodeoxyribonuclease VII large subunit